MAAISAVTAPAALALLYIALSSGEASRVIPVTAAYPLVTVALAFVLLGESLSPTRVMGAALVVTGVALLTVHR